MALHPQWVGWIELVPTTGEAKHIGVGSVGIYHEIEPGVITIIWDRFPAERFLISDNILIHETIQPLDVNKIVQASVENAIYRVKDVSIWLPGSQNAVRIRPLTSDSRVFDQIFHNLEYDIKALPPNPKYIVDLGANIGLAALYFGLKYPSAGILCVEPDIGNFSYLASNVAELGSRVVIENAAIWISDGCVDLETVADDGTPLGEWGLQVKASNSNHSTNSVKCYRLDTLMQMVGFDSIDVLKIDIEGAELELFSHESRRRWIGKTKFIIIETHDRFRPGSEAAVRAALGEAFVEIDGSGENLVFKRRDA